MNHRKLLSVFASLAVLMMAIHFSSCNSNQSPGPTFLAGHLPGLASSEIKASFDKQEFLVHTDDAGYFHMELELDWDRYLWFQGIDRYLYLVPGDSMFLSKEKSAPSSFSFSGGESGLINTWYALKETKLNAIFDTTNVKTYYSLEAQTYLELNSFVIAEFFDLLDQFSQENPGISDSFIALEKNNISHYWYYELNVYHAENYAYTGIKPRFPDTFYDYLGSVRLNDTLLFQYEGYRYFLYSWLDLQLHLQGKGLTGVEKTHQLFDVAEKAFTAPEILADVIWEKLRLQNNRMAVDENLLSRASELGVPREKLENARAYMERLQPMAEGNPAPDFELMDVRGHKTSLNDFKGKYMVIDVWSHTCGPCIREIPRLEDIKHDLEGRNLDIITLCLSDEKPWKDKLAELGLPDEGQYRLEKGWGSPFNNNYLRGSGVPTYIVLDPDGNFVNARAPLPSEGLREYLEALDI